MTRILITGKNSYIGTSFIRSITNDSNNYLVDTITLKTNDWEAVDFSQYDLVIHLAALVHRKEKSNMKHLFFEVNTELTYKVALKAKLAGVKKFIFMSSVAVYGMQGEVDKNVEITFDTECNPKTLYGKSKLQAERELEKLNSEDFKVIIIRAPMVYGPSCPGNYERLERVVRVLPIFPDISNYRSLIRIDRLCKFIKYTIDNDVCGIFLPHDEKCISTCQLIQEFANKNGKKVYFSKTLGWIIRKLFCKTTVVKKMFGNLIIKDNSLKEEGEQ